MFEACLQKSFLFKKIIESTRDLVTEVNLECLESGISFKAMDGSRIALISVFLNSEDFDEFVCVRAVSVGVNLSSLNKILTRANDNASMLVKIDQDSLDTINVEFKGLANGYNCNYDLKLLDLEQDQLSIPELDYATIITLPSTKFKKICQDLMVTGGDSAAITVKKNEKMARFTSLGDFGTCNIELEPQDPNDPEGPIMINAGDDINMSFSLKYLCMFTKATVLSERVNVYFRDRMPVLVEYKTGSSYVRYYLAPKVEDDE